MSADQSNSQLGAEGLGGESRSDQQSPRDEKPGDPFLSATSGRAAPLNITADNPKDWATLQLRTRDGREVIILNVLAHPNVLVGGRTVVAMYLCRPGEKEWALNSWFANGRFYPGDRIDGIDLLSAESASTDK